MVGTEGDFIGRTYRGSGDRRSNEIERHESNRETDATGGSHPANYIADLVSAAGSDSKICGEDIGRTFGKRSGGLDHFRSNGRSDAVVRDGGSGTGIAGAFFQETSIRESHKEISLYSFFITKKPRVYKMGKMKYNKNSA